MIGESEPLTDIVRLRDGSAEGEREANVGECEIAPPGDLGGPDDGLDDVARQAAPEREREL